ncbi:hypothetical protein NP233_g11027 [Leucocoprinus birnbaumii]|uniref:F-box domain-containing protein n=1 Tax=Leucocoprinus birnbaumii TaxID=56174 RepID=A0AAD5VJ95_9AGAR|nr:hypothetical protein NP233_g11027 [Leucocoprinus birnbaumii]
MEQALLPHSSPVNQDDEDLIYTTQALRRLEEQVENISGKVEVLENRLEILQQQRKVLERHIGIQESLRVPISRIPQSLLRKIFMFCLPFTWNPTMSNREAPVLLSQVCRLWRRVAFDTPQLWSSIHITLNTSRHSRFLTYATRKYDAIQLQAISSWLRRSSDLPLSISLVASDPLLAANLTHIVERAAKPYLKLLSSFASRWRTIYFMVYGVDWIETFFSRFTRKDLPLLEKVHIDGIKCNSGKLTKARALEALKGDNSMLRCPKLWCLSLPLLGELMVQVPAPWSQLTTLNLNGAYTCTMFQIMSTLGSCPSLEYLSVCFDIASAGADLALEHAVMLPRLISLSITDHCTSYDCLRFLNHLHAPNIRSIYYDRFAPSPWLSHIITRESLSKGLLKAFRAFISRTKGPIEELSLQYEWLAEGDLYKFLALLPDLKRLSLIGIGNSMARNAIELQSKPAALDDRVLLNLLTIPEKRNIVVVTRDLGDTEEGQAFDDESGESGDSRSRPTNYPVGITRVTDGEGGGDAWQETYNFFCPKLEALHCTSAVFSGQSILRFLQSRSLSNKRFGISRIRGVDITFDSAQEEPPSEVIEEIKELGEEAEISIFLHYMNKEQDSPTPMPPTSVRDGMTLVGFRDHVVSVFNSVF